MFLEIGPSMRSTTMGAAKCRSADVFEKTFRTTGNFLAATAFIVVGNSESPRQGAAVFRFTIREVLWLTLIVAVTTGWWLESNRSQQWRQRAEIAAGQLEAENLGRMIFSDQTAVFHSLQY